MLFLLVLIASAAHGLLLCDTHDRMIYDERGQEFEALFRSFGGLTVSKESYEVSVSRAVGLSASCATCYGDAYICGYDHCFWSCARAGAKCSMCLERADCIRKCNECTKFETV